METPSTTRPLGFFRGGRTLFLTMGFALLILTPAQPAGAEPAAQPGTAGTGPVEAREMMGGHATVEVTRTVNGVSRTMVAYSAEGLETASWVQNESAVTAFQANYSVLISARQVDPHLQADDAHPG